MGVVRREGQWRLEKLEAGHYELTYQQQTEAKILTPEYSPAMMDEVSLAPVPVHEVDSYAEAEGIFEEHAHGSQPGGSDLFGSGSSTSSSGSAEQTGFGAGSASGSGAEVGGSEQELLEGAENLPPGGIALVLVLVGGIAISTYGFAPGEPVVLFAAGMVGIGVLIFAWGAVLFRTKGWREAVEFLFSMEEADSSSTESSSSNNEQSPTTRTPVPEKRKRELIFGRAEQECEWCDDHLDTPEVHHIEPQSEGGSNDPGNLIVLCPTCHRKADQGGISKTKLRQKLRHSRSG